MKGYIGALAVLVGCADQARIDDVLALEGDEASGAELYASSCASCHGDDGSGGVGPSLIANVPDQSDDELVDTLLNGPESMPSFADLEDQELADILAYLRGEFGG